ncbi:MAG: hypothetical protein Q7S65_00945 [Nanoarchaeota archaeon]|nr:hypothetical protein [Nanoarchaeota archaeon]
MGVLSILLFCAYTYGLGTLCTLFWKEEGYEKHLMRVGVGLGAWVVLLVLLDFFGLPVDWRIVLAVSLLGCALAAYRARASLSFKLRAPSVFAAVVLVLFGLTLFMYAEGAFAYPYFEDDDPWGHATGIKYISVEKNFNDPHKQFGYIDPYPPGYDGVFAILHQTSPELMWTMKFFNALICALGVVFFAFFAKRFFKDTSKALAATAIFAVIPSYLSHFIWAHSLAITLFLVALYCLVRISEDKRWIAPTAFAIGGICLTQPSKPLKYAVMLFIFLAAYSWSRKKLRWEEAGAVFGGYALSLLWWGTRVMSMLAGLKTPADKVLVSASQTGLWAWLQRVFPPGTGTGTRAYTVSDFFVAKGQNMINNPVGWGIGISLLLAVGILVFIHKIRKSPREEHALPLTLLLWFVFAFIGVNALTFSLPVGFHAFRFWMTLAIPVSLIAAEGFVFVARFLSRLKIPMAVSISLLVVLLFFTSGLQKYQVNTAAWGPGASWTSGEELQGYLSLLSLPPNTPVFTYGDSEPVIGLNAYDCMWCDEVFEFKKQALLVNATALQPWLKEQGYQYLVVSGRTIMELAPTYGNRTSVLVNTRLQDLSNSGLFELAYQNNALVLFKLA